MTLDQLKAEALNLPEESRISLFESLLRSFEEASGLDDEIARAWMEEAARRDREMGEGPEAEIPAEEVFARLRSRPR